MLTLWVATRNRHKLVEIQDILGGDVVCRSMDTLPGAPQLVEDADTFAGNATGKAKQLAAWLAQQPNAAPCWVLADDSGLEVDALHGAPGVRSARFAADDSANPDNASDAANNAKLVHLLKAVPDERRTARFRCVLALVMVGTGDATEDPHLFDGVCEGRIAWAVSGTGGFGYDPLFVPLESDRSFAEIGESEKNRISHRGAALRAFRAWLDACGGPSGQVDHKTA